MSLSALLERVEACQGPDQELDAAIYKALGDGATHRGGLIGWNWRPGNVGIWHTMPPLTASVDAALALIGRVLPGWWVQHLGQNLAGWGVRIETQGLSIPLSNRLLIAPTPALALCAALLAAMIGEEAKP